MRRESGGGLALGGGGKLTCEAWETGGALALSLPSRFANLEAAHVGNRGLRGLDIYEADWLLDSGASNPLTGKSPAAEWPAVGGVGRSWPLAGPSELCWSKLAVGPGYPVRA